jgi:hypothetical protein
VRTDLCPNTVAEESFLEDCVLKLCNCVLPLSDLLHSDACLSLAIRISATGQRSRHTNNASIKSGGVQSVELGIIVRFEDVVWRPNAVALACKLFLETACWFAGLYASRKTSTR